MDPGAVAKPVRRRKPLSPGRCLLWSCGGLGVLVFVVFVGFIGYGMFQGTKFAIKNARDPHFHHFNATAKGSAPVEPPVLPLVDRDTKFDIAFTIWARLPDAETSHPELYAQQGDDQAYSLSGNDELAGSGFAKADQKASLELTAAAIRRPVVEVLHTPQERAVFSEVLFHGVSLNDSTMEKEIQYQLPLHRFQDAYAYVTDVRAAFSILPHVPSRLDEVLSYTDSRPDAVKVPTRLPADQAEKWAVAHKGGFDQSWYDQVENMGHSGGLVSLVEEADRCPFPPKNTTEELERKGITSFARYAQPWLLTSADNTSRTDHYRIFCDAAEATTHRLWQTAFKVSPDSNADRDPTSETQLAYKPYFDVLSYSSGPKHLVRLPVKRPGCPPWPETVDTPESMTINHTVRFSVLSAGRLNLLSQEFLHHPVIHNATDKERENAHHVWETTGGMLGESHPDIRPFTRFIIGFIKETLSSIIVPLLYFVYWYTRGTTAGLDIPATYLLMAGSAFDIITRGLEAYHDRPDHWVPKVFAALDLLSSMVPIALQLRLLQPWSRAAPTRAERVSIRKSKTIGFGFRISILAGLMFISYVTPKVLLLRTATHAPIPYRTLPPLPIKLFLDASPHILFTLYWSAAIHQLIMNDKCRTYAGSLGITAYALAIHFVLAVASEMSWIVGRISMREEISLADVIEVCAMGGMVWQAATLPKVPQVVKAEDEGAE